MREYDQCLRCGRNLKNPKAREAGMGKVCAAKAAEQEARNGIENQTKIEELSKEGN